MTYQSPRVSSRVQPLVLMLPLSLLLLASSCEDSTTSRPTTDVAERAAAGDGAAMDALVDRTVAAVQAEARRTEQAAADGDPAAQVAAALASRENYEALEPLADAGNVLAMLEYGRYLQAYDDQPRRERGRDWLVRAAERGNAEALFTAGKMSLDGTRTFAKDGAQGRAWLEQAARAGHGEAAFTLGVQLRFGLSLPADEAGALDWLKVSSAAGFASADDMLAEMGATAD